MKNIKLLSTLALSASLLSVGSVAVSAAVINATGTATETSVGSAGFVTDNTTIVTPQVPGGKGPDTLPPGPENPDTVDPNVKASDLALYAHPTEFNFGVTKISAADKQKSTVVLTQKNGRLLTIMLMELIQQIQPNCINVIFKVYVFRMVV